MVTCESASPAMTGGYFKDTPISSISTPSRSWNPKWAERPGWSLQCWQRKIRQLQDVPVSVDNDQPA